MRKFWIFILILCFVVIIGTVTYIYWDDINTYVNSVLNPEEEDNTQKPGSDNNNNYVCNTLEVHYIQLPYIGDSTLIKCGDFDMLVDGGDVVNASIQALNAYLKNVITDNKIEVLIASHSDADHIGGLYGTKSNPGVLFNYKIDYIIDYGFDHTTALSKNYVEKRDEHISNGTKYCAAKDFVNKVEGCTFNYKINSETSFNIIDTGYYLTKQSNPNDNSVSFELLHHDYKYLFTADLETKGENYLVQQGLTKYDVFQAGHHGAASSNSSSFLEMIEPSEIILSYALSGNTYGIPQQESLNRMYAVTNNIYTTYTNGTIILESKKENYSFKFSTNDLLFHQSDWFKANRYYPLATIL